MGLTAGSIVAGVASYGTLVGCQQVLGKTRFTDFAVELSISGLVGIGVFAVIASWLKIPEVNIFVDRMRSRFFKAKG